jgi:hypothetical protein
MHQNQNRYLTSVDYALSHCSFWRQKYLTKMQIFHPNTFTAPVTGKYQLNACFY